ncbi:MAG: GDSL-type esterase/lipase family protein [Thiohalocapsa sp.]
MLISVWFVFVFLLLELAGFVFYKLEVSRPVSGYGYPAGLIVAHPQLGYVYQPGYSGFFKGTAYQDIPIEINAQGFRDADFVARSGDGRRVAVLGDSVVFGAGVVQQDRFTECLENAPGSRQASNRRMLNLGVHSYTFGHYLALAELDFLGAAPEAVLIGITLNDFEPMDAIGPARRMQRHQSEWHTPDWLRRIGDRIGRTYAVRFVQEIQNRFSYAMLNADEREQYHTKWMRSVVKGWQSDETAQFFAEQLDQLAARLEKANIPFGFIVFPELNDLQSPVDFGAPRQLVRKLLDQRGLRYCDPYDEFARQGAVESLFLDRDSIHYSPKGHQILCAVVERCIDEMDLAGLANRGSP